MPLLLNINFKLCLTKIINMYRFQTYSVKSMAVNIKNYYLGYTLKAFINPKPCWMCFAINCKKNYLDFCDFKYFKLKCTKNNICNVFKGVSASWSRYYKS